MNVPRIYKMIVVSSALVVLAGISLRMSERGREDSSAAVPNDQVEDGNASPNQRPLPKHLHHSAGVTPLTETLEEGAVDFDWRRVLRDKTKPPKLPRAEVEKYLERNKRNAVSLLAACRALNDTKYLKEAAANFPNDPRVQLSVLVRDVFPETRRHWLDSFEASSPDNSLADYLSAWDYFRSGQTEAAMNELQEATRKPAFKDYVLESKQSDEELNLASGRSLIQSKLAALGWTEELMPELAKLKWLSRDMAELQKQFLGASDVQSVERSAQMGLTLANRLNSGDGAQLTINQLVGMAIEALTLRELDQNARYDFLGGKTPNDRTDELKQRKSSYYTLYEGFFGAYSNATEAELLSYYDRAKLHGQEEAMRWFTTKQVPP